MVVYLQAARRGTTCGPLSARALAVSLSHLLTGTCRPAGTGQRVTGGVTLRLRVRLRLRLNHDHHNLVLLLLVVVGRSPVGGECRVTTHTDTATVLVSLITHADGHVDVSGKLTVKPL